MAAPAPRAPRTLRPPAAHPDADRPAPAVGSEAERWLAGLLCALRIAHQIKGRVRLKLATTTPRLGASLSLSRSDQSPADGLKQLLAALPGVHDIQLNLLARSCVITYDPTRISDAAWPELLAGQHTPAATALQGLLLGALSDLPLSLEESAR